jgi:ABC-type ATPase involved in cell division
VLATQPARVLADEPTGNLDRHTPARAFEMIPVALGAQVRVFWNNSERPAVDDHGTHGVTFSQGGRK